MHFGRLKYIIKKKNSTLGIFITLLTYFSYKLHIFYKQISCFFKNTFYVFYKYILRIFNTYYTICTDSIIHKWPVTSEHGGKGDHGSKHGSVLKSMYLACWTDVTTGLACTSSITREYMEHGGRLPANCALTVYYLPVFPPYSDSNYGLCWLNAPLIYKDRFMYVDVWKCRHRILSHVLYICRLYPKPFWSVLFNAHWADCRLAQLLTVKAILIYLQCLRWNGLGVWLNFIFLFRFQLVLSINMSSDKRFMVNSCPSEKWQNVIDNPLASFSEVITGVPL